MNAQTPARPQQALHWQCLPFERLSAHSLYAILQLRAEVFVVEQACVFQDMDGADAACFHLLGTDATALPGLAGCIESADPVPTRPLLAYARLVPAGLKYAEASIGRVVTSPAARGRALGHALMAQACRQLVSLWGPQPIRIGAQAHLQAFYGQHGFVTDSPPYMEDGIPHVEMLRPA